MSDVFVKQIDPPERPEPADDVEQCLEACNWSLCVATMKKLNWLWIDEVGGFSAASQESLKRTAKHLLYEALKSPGQLFEHGPIQAIQIDGVLRVQFILAWGLA